MMRIVDSNAIDALAASEEVIPHLFHARRFAATLVVNEWVAVVYLDELVPLHAGKNFFRECPAEVGMIDVRNALYFAHGIYVLLNGAEKCAVGAWNDYTRNVES